jgi:hypothetical protein
MDVRLSAPSGPLKRPKRLGGRSAEAKWTWRKQLSIPLGLSVHQESHDSTLLAGRPATARPLPASAWTPSCLRRDANVPLPGRRPASARPSPCLRPVTAYLRQAAAPEIPQSSPPLRSLRGSSNPSPPVHQGTAPPSTLLVPSHTCVLLSAGNSFSSVFELVSIGLVRTG